MRKLKGFFLLIAAISTLAVIFAGCDGVLLPPPPRQLSTSIVPVGGGTINPSSGPFTGGSNVVLVANPAQCYKFVGWAGDASGNTNPLTVNMNSNKQIVAQFSKITYIVRVKSNLVPSCKEDYNFPRPSVGED